MAQYQQQRGGVCQGGEREREREREIEREGERGRGRERGERGKEREGRSVPLTLSLSLCLPFRISPNEVKLDDYECSSKKPVICRRDP